mmetsp:Transcript_43474/g.31298  ORF Transcript_43474/g.31298 Transcript_43474/m.31298 type:complete len:98 (+) Transcript_43474:501-794(+)
MQEFEYEYKYDCVWMQWCLCYLTDPDLKDYLIRTRDNMHIAEDGRKGIVFIKENIYDDGFVHDKDDNSVVRSDQHFRAIFKEAGYEVLAHKHQKGFP